MGLSSDGSRIHEGLRLPFDGENASVPNAQVELPPTSGPESMKGFTGG